MKFDIVATGFHFLEAPREDRKAVFFTDTWQGGIYRWLPGGKIDRWLPERRWIGGIAVNEDGSILCSGKDGIAWVNPVTGATGMLLDRVDGKLLTGVNDMLPDAQGGLYFGVADVAEVDHGGQRRPSALFRLDTKGQLTQLCEELIFANGIGLSPDGQRLYCNDTFVGTYAYDVRPDGTLGTRVLLASQRDCDGLAVDCEGAIWIAGFRSGAITRLLPDGTVDRRVPLPVDEVTSLCFGGSDWRDLYVTTAAPNAMAALATGRAPAVGASLYLGRSEVAGQPIRRTAFTL